MKKKFDLKSNKIKGISFHKTRQNWVAIGLFTGEVQIWDFRNGFKIADFKDSEVCIRSIDFHPLQCIIVAGGDDFFIRGYDYSENKKAFELKGHVDFVRTVQFHNELPWVLSCSDDQTLRIWNWQSKTQLSVITGHSHYVMCARFHPTKDLIASCSLDSNLRIWDFSKLKSRFSSSHGTVYMLSNDVEATIIAETHTKGVNWVEFHPTDDLLATCSDDKLIKIWKFTTTGAYEEISLHGHTGNVSSITFTPDGKHLVSNSEDFHVRYWDLKSGICLQKFIVDPERQWTVAVHPQLPLIATGGDKSLVIISMNSEKIQFDTTKYGVLVFFSSRDFSLKVFILSTGITMTLNPGQKNRMSELTEKRVATNLSLNPFCQGTSVSGSINLVISGDSICHVFSGVLNESFSITPIKAKQAVFLSSEKVLTLGEDGKLRLIKLQGLSLLNDFEVNFDVDAIFQGSAGKAFLRSGTKIILYDFLAKRELFTIEDEDFSVTKKVQWSSNKTFFSILTKFSVHIFDKKGKKRCAKKEESKIKSGIWGQDNVFFYNTHEHIKFVLKDGEVGLVRSINKIMFLSFYINRKIIAFDVNENFEEIELDMTEIEFKNAFLKRSGEDVKDILKDKQFLGKSMVAHLLNKKFNSIALQLTTDKETGFYLAFYSKNFAKAFELAEALGQGNLFDLLGNECMTFGIDDLAEKCFKASGNKPKLMSLYNLTGNFEKLKNMEVDDRMMNFNRTLLSGDVAERVRILSDSGQVYLAYATAVTNGLSDFANRLEQAYPDIKNKVKIPNIGNISPCLRSVAPANRTCQKILLNTVDSDDVKAAFDELSEEEQDDGTGVQLVTFGAQQQLENKSSFGMTHNKIDQEDFQAENSSKQGPIHQIPVTIDLEDVENAWGLEDADVLNQFGEDQTNVTPKELPTTNTRTDVFFEEEDPLVLKIKKSCAFAADLFSIGEIEAGINLLKNQVGLKSAKPLSNYIMELSLYSKFYSCTSIDTLKSRTHLLCKSPEQMITHYPFDVFRSKFDAIMFLVTKAKIPEAVDLLKTTNILSLLVKPETIAEAESLQFLKNKLLNYSIALRAKLLSDKTTDVKRKIELCLVMSCCSIEPAHRLLILQLAFNFAVKIENYLHGLILVRKYLKISQDNPGIAKEEAVSKMKKFELLCEQKGKNTHEFAFKEKYLYEESIVDRIDFEQLQIYFPETTNESQILRCLFDRSSYDYERKGTICSYCEMCEIGYDAVQYSVVDVFKRLSGK